MSARSKLTASAVVASLATGGLLLSAAPSYASTTYNGACGSGYVEIDSMSANVTGFQAGTIFLTYNASNGYNCVETQTATPGTSAELIAMIELSGTNTTWNEDEGTYKYYAGPRYVHAPDSCIDWGGAAAAADWGPIADLPVNIDWSSYCS